MHAVLKALSLWICIYQFISSHEPNAQKLGCSVYTMILIN